MNAKKAPCVGATHLMYAEGRGVGYGKARTMCADCPLKRECLDTAMHEETKSERSRYGMWGGLSPEERAKSERFSDPKEREAYIQAIWNKNLKFKEVAGTGAGPASKRLARNA